MVSIACPQCYFDKGLHGLLAEGGKEPEITTFGKTEQ